MARRGQDRRGGGPGRTTHFGFSTVAEEEKGTLVRGVFERVAWRYDLMNDLMSLGAHRFWKAALVDWLMPQPGREHLDVAGGTGDVARRVLAAARGAGRVTVCDVNPAMLARGRARGGLGLDWVAGDAEALPFADRRFDSYTIAFGLRNVTHIDGALLEARRVLKPGGRFLCLEFSRVEAPLLGPLYDRYSFSVIPRLGALVARDRAAYQYLVESIRRFPPQDALAEMIGAAGLGRVQVRNLSGGIVALHSAWRV